MSSEDHEDAGTFAELVLSVARKLSTQELDDTQIVQLTNLESVIMRYIDDNPGVTPSRIGTELGLSSGNMSATLRALEAKELVQRNPDAADRRVVRVYPTKKAAANLKLLHAAWSRALSPLLPPGVDLQPLIDALDQVNTNLQAAQKPTP